MPRPILMNGVGSEQDITEVRTVAAHRPGLRGMLDDGRVFYYAQLDAAAALIRGELAASSAPVANHQGQTQTTSGTTLIAGRSEVNVDVGATNVNIGQYEDGFLSITDSTGEGFSYRIREHTSRTGAGVITLDLYDPIVIAGSATSVASLFKNPFHDLRTAPAAVAPTMGVTPVAVAAGSGDASVTLRNVTSRFFWVQTWGFCSVNGGTIATAAAVGATVSSSPGTAGAIDGMAAAANDTRPIVGQMMAAAGTGLFIPVFLRLVP